MKRDVRGKNKGSLSEWLIMIVNVEYDDKNYTMYKSATQPKFNSSNSCWFIKNKIVCSFIS